MMQCIRETECVEKLADVEDLGYFFASVKETLRMNIAGPMFLALNSATNRQH